MIFHFAVFCQDGLAARTIAVISRCRYMTAIITWVGAKGWTTTGMESAIFAEYP
jgi:hypothetical protein